MVRKILWGKRTDVFQAVENETLDENVCFSMQTSDYTIDFECDSRYVQLLAYKYIYTHLHIIFVYIHRLQRDVIARGFSIVISSIDSNGKLRLEFQKS